MAAGAARGHPSSMRIRAKRGPACGTRGTAGVAKNLRLPQYYMSPHASPLPSGAKISFRSTAMKLSTRALFLSTLALLLPLTAHAAAPSVSISDASVKEGGSGTTEAVFSVSLSAADGQRVTVNYATADDTATAGADYQSASGTLSFAPGETSKSFTVTILNDALD